MATLDKNQHNFGMKIGGRLTWEDFALCKSAQSEDVSSIWPWHYYNFMPRSVADAIKPRIIQISEPQYQSDGKWRQVPVHKIDGEPYTSDPAWNVGAADKIGGRGGARYRIVSPMDRDIDGVEFFANTAGRTSPVVNFLKKDRYNDLSIDKINYLLWNDFRDPITKGKSLKDLGFDSTDIGDGMKAHHLFRNMPLIGKHCDTYDINRRCDLYKDPLELMARKTKSVARKTKSVARDIVRWLPL